MTTNNEKFLNDYSEFVESVMSATSLDTEVYIDRLRELMGTGIEPSLLQTGAIGLAGESGEFNDLVKKIMFQGKPITDETRTHLEKELGDIFFYWTTACMALSVDPYAVIAKNQFKLSNRYPEGFSTTRSENKPATDV
jgi:NTP pyrophosphatase (non-canonical NTP hydrolase)